MSESDIEKLMDYYPSDKEDDIVEFQIGDKTFQNLDGQLADKDDNLILFQNEPIALQVNPHPIVSAIHAMKDNNGVRIYQIPKQPLEERFAKIVEAMTDMHRTDGRWKKEYGLIPMEKARTNPHSFQRAHELMDMGFHKDAKGKPVQNKFGNQKNYEKFLHVGKNAGLMSERKAIVKPAVPRSIKSKKLVQEKLDFGRLKEWEHTNPRTGKKEIKQPNPYIVKWQKKREKHQGQAYTDKLWKILQWLDLDLESLVHPTYEKGHPKEGELIEDNAEKKDWLTERMAKPTFKDREGKMHHFGKIDKTDKSNIKYTGLVFDRYIPSHDYQGKKISTKGGGKFGIDDRTRKYVQGSQGRRMPLIASLKGFLDANGWSIGDNVGINMWALKTAKAKYGAIKMKAQQIIDMFAILRDGADGKKGFKHYKFKTLDWHKIEVDTYTDWDTDQSFWKDARDFFIIGLQIGWRSGEAFSATAKWLDSDDAEDSGAFWDKDTDVFTLKIYTRKTEHVGRKFQGGYILLEDTGHIARTYIENRIKEVEKGIGIIRKLDNGEDNTEHALIGVDGRYTKVGTMKFPSTAGLTEAEKIRMDEAGEVIPQVRPTVHREKLLAILDHCFTLVGLTDSYWHTHSGHSVRHTFAQLWMKKSGNNLVFVKDWGHWGNMDVVAKHYAKPSKSEEVAIAKQFNANKLQDIAKREKDVEDESEEKRRQIIATSNQIYGMDSDEPVDESNKDLTDVGKSDPDTMPDDTDADAEVDKQ